jgi:hypothetical protein
VGGLSPLLHGTATASEHNSKTAEQLKQLLLLVVAVQPAWLALAE